MDSLPSWLNSTNLTSAAKGFEVGVNISISKNAENTTKQGTNYYLSLPHQLSQIGLAFSYLSTLPPLSDGGFKFSNYTTPLLFTAWSFNVASAMYRQNHYQPRSIYMQRACGFFADHSGDLMQGLTAVVSIAKFALGQQVEAVVNLSFLGIGVLDRQGYLPLTVSIVFRKYLPPIALLSGLVLGTTFIQFYCAVSLIAYIAPPIIARIKYVADDFIEHKMSARGLPYPTLRELEQSKAQSSHRFSKEEILSFNEDTPLLVDPVHASRKPNFDLTGIAIPARGDKAPCLPLLDLFDSIDWKNQKTFKSLHKLVITDDRWTNEKKSWNEKTKAIEANKDKEKDKWKQFLIDWTRVQLEAFIDNVSLKKQPKGDLSGFNEKRRQLVAVVKYMQKLREENSPEKNNTLQDMLLKFAIEGGDHCVNALTGVISDNLDTALNNGGIATDFRTRLDAHLLNHRKNIFIGFYSTITKNNPVTNILGRHDRHNINEAIRYFGHGLGLDMEEAHRDNSIVLDPLVEFLFTLLPVIRRGFWQNAFPKTRNLKEEIKHLIPQGHLKNCKIILLSLISGMQDLFQDAYSENTILDAFEELYHNQTIEPLNLLDWWQKYIKDNFDGDEELSDLVTDSENGIVTSDNKLNRKFLKIMAVELGYLRK